MRITSEKTLDLFRGPGPCELCGCWAYHRDAHHAFITVGAGGSDAPENLAGLHRLCHDKAGNSHAENLKVHDAIARRIGQPIWKILGWLHSVRNSPKEGPCPERPWLLAGGGGEGPSGPGGEGDGPLPDLLDEVGQVDRPTRAKVGEVRRF